MNPTQGTRMPLPRSARWVSRPTTTLPPVAASEPAPKWEAEERRTQTRRIYPPAVEVDRSSRGDHEWRRMGERRAVRGGFVERNPDVAKKPFDRLRALRRACEAVTPADDPITVDDGGAQPRSTEVYRNDG